MKQESAAAASAPPTAVTPANVAAVVGFAVAAAYIANRGRPAIDTRRTLVAAGCAAAVAVLVIYFMTSNKTPPAAAITPAPDAFHANQASAMMRDEGVRQRQYAARIRQQQLLRQQQQSQMYDDDEYEGGDQYADDDGGDNEDFGAINTRGGRMVVNAGDSSEEDEPPRRRRQPRAAPTEEDKDVDFARAFHASVGNKAPMFSDRDGKQALAPIGGDAKGDGSKSSRKQGGARGPAPPGAYCPPDPDRVVVVRDKSGAAEVDASIFEQFNTQKEDDGGASLMQIFGQATVSDRIGSSDLDPIQHQDDPVDVGTQAERMMEARKADDMASRERRRLQLEAEVKRAKKKIESAVASTPKRHSTRSGGGRQQPRQQQQSLTPPMRARD